MFNDSMAQLALDHVDLKMTSWASSNGMVTLLLCTGFLTRRENIQFSEATTGRLVTSTSSKSISYVNELLGPLRKFRTFGDPCEKF